MQKEFKKGEALRAEDLNELVQAISEMEAALPSTCAALPPAKQGRPGVAFYNVKADEVPAFVLPTVGSGTLNSGGMLQGISYGGELLGKIVRGHAVLPVPAVGDYDGEYTMVDGGGVIPLPVMVKAVVDVGGQVWPLADLTTGAGLAATVAQCTLPDGTQLRLKVHTVRGGTALNFALECGAGYGS